MATDSAEEILIDDESHESPANDKIKFHSIATWKIKNFSCCQMECGEEIFSPLFCADPAGRIKWYLTIFPNGQINFEEFVSIHVIFIKSTESIPGNLKASCRVSIIDLESNTWVCDRIDQELTRFQFNSFVRRERLIEESNTVFPQDVLTIRCQISAFDERLLELGPGISNETLSPRNELLQEFSDDFKKLFESGKFSDVNLEMRDGTIPAHKIILISRSPVFADLFLDSEVNQSVPIPSYDKSTMNALVSYIYCGRIGTSSSVLSLDLYDAAEKFKVRGLCDAITPNKVLAQTEITNETFTYTWRLKNFSSMTTQTPIRYSEKFHTGPSCRSWSLSVCFQKVPNDDSDLNIGIYLNKLWATGEKKAVYIHFSICLLDKEQQPRYTVQAKKLYKHSGRYGFPNFIKKSNLLEQQSDLLVADTLTIQCKMKVCDGASSSKVQHSFTSSSNVEINDVEKVSICFRELLSSELHCNVVVHATEKEFCLHKPILCARSTVFADFFDRYSNGLSSYTINVQGIKADILELLFVFVYTGLLEEGLSCGTAPGLFAAADHYKISGLRRICSDFMKRNACEIIVLVNQSSDVKMKDLVKDFICSNAEDVIMSNQWTEFVKNHPHLSSEILKSLTCGYRKAKKRRVE